ncbi:type II toxin-antitoxin system VapC family toxin [Alsobacter sp. KACC 23698]|uniref:Type II toxin-antitoxin system VapC family toxin n=1 Tax=Alsobacter sp. KACC 23698 TaxID=3149229 RepID=A0AAU7JB92_9HYPH
MYVDACAIIAIMADEESAEAYNEALRDAVSPWTSVLAAWEAIIVLASPGQLDCSYRQAEHALVDWMEERGIALRTASDLRAVLSHAVGVAEDYGIGKRRLSNFDCFHYAYAKEAGASLLTMDRLLRSTDIETIPAAP